MHTKRNILLVFIVSVLFISGCSDKSVNKTSNTFPLTTNNQISANSQIAIETPNDITKQKENDSISRDVSSNQDGYVLVTETLVAFIQWTEANNELTGQLQVYNVDTDGLKADITSNPFTGIHNSSNISVTFSGSVWSDSLSNTTWTGTLKGNDLTFVIPSNDGKLNTVTFTKGSIEEYNDKVTEFQKSISKTKLDRDIAREAQEQQKNIVKSNKNYTDAYYELLSDVQKLTDSSTFDDIKENYSEAWKNIQKEYKEMKDSANVKPLTNYDLGDVKDKLANVKYAMGDISYQEGDLNYRTNIAIQNIETVKNDIVVLKKAYDIFLKLDKSSADKNADEYKNIIDSAKNQIEVSNKMVSNIKTVATWQGNGYR